MGRWLCLSSCVYLYICTAVHPSSCIIRERRSQGNSRSLFFLIKEREDCRKSAYRKKKKNEKCVSLAPIFRIVFHILFETALAKNNFFTSALFAPPSYNPQYYEYAPPFLHRTFKDLFFNLQPMSIFYGKSSNCAKKKIQLFFFSEFIIFTKMMVGSFEGKWRSREKKNQKWKNTGEAKERTEKIFRKRKKEIQ